MPEGDTIHTIARAMERWIDGAVVHDVRLDGRPLAELDGLAVRRIHARGKHLLVELAGGESLRAHLGMTGSWHRYAPGARWEKPRDAASLAFRAGEFDYVCFHAREVELLRPGTLAATTLDRRLGPDLVADRCDLARAVANSLASSHPALCDVLLDQRVAAGIGNVYKAELCFLHGLHPTTPPSLVEEDRWRGLYADARRLLRANLAGGPRVTRRASPDADERLWVFGRDERPCHRCGTSIVGGRTGATDRWTSWCPRCQRDRVR